MEGGFSQIQSNICISFPRQNLMLLHKAQFLIALCIFEVLMVSPSSLLTHYCMIYVQKGYILAKENSENAASQEAKKATQQAAHTEYSHCFVAP